MQLDLKTSEKPMDSRLIETLMRIGISSLQYNDYPDVLPLRSLTYYSHLISTVFDLPFTLVELV
jgi:hypothetical protein